MNIRWNLLSLLGIATWSGCVTPARHASIERQLEATRAALSASQAAWDEERSRWEAERSERDEREAELRAELESCRQHLQETEASLADTSAQLQEANERLARLLKDRTALEASVEEMREALADAQRAEVLEARLKDREELIQALRTMIAEKEAQLEAARRETERLGQEVAALQAEKARLLASRAELTASVEEMKAALENLSAQKAAAEARLEELRAVVASLRPLIDAGQLAVRIVDGRMVVQLPSDVLFASGSAELSSAGREAVQAVAPVLVSVPGRTFLVEGHTDNVPISTSRFPDNWALAAARAITVVHTLVDAGMPPDRLAAAAYADTRPVADNATPEGRAANRRIEIAILPDLSLMPGAEDLESLLGGEG